MRTRSLPARLKSLCNSWGIGTPKKRHWAESRRSRTFAIEPLEERALLSLCVWDGGGTDDKWTTAENWANDIAPVVGDDLRFSGTVQTDTENDYTAGTSFRSINFASSGFEITGNDLTLTNNITVNSGVTGSTVFVGVGLGSTVTVNSGNTSLTLSGVISGNNALVKSNSGTLILTGNNTYTGTTTITYGTLQVGNGGTSGTLGTGAVTGGDDEDSVTLAFNRSDTATIGNSISGYVNMVQRGTGTLIYTGNDSCSGGVTVNSGGTLVLTGSNTYTHTTTINAGGTLRIGSDNPSVLPNGSGKANVTVKGVLDLNGYAPTVNGLDGTGTVTSSVAGATTLTVGAGNRSGSFSGVIQDGAGTVALTKTGTATQTLTGNNTYSGTTTIGQGTLQVGSAYTGTLGTGPVVNNGLLRFYRSMTIANSISGTGGLYVGYGTLILTGNNTYSGTTTIRGNATLQVGNGGTSGTLGTGAVTGGDDEDNATLTFNRSDIVTIDKSISGYIDLIQDGTGTLIYTGNNSCSGGMTVNSGGTLVLTGSNTYTRTTTVNAGGTLQIGSDNPSVLPNGSGKANVTVNGVLDLNGYAPTVNGLDGTGRVTSGVAGATTLTVGAGNRSGSFSGVIQDGAGTVALTKTGTATQTLTGNNTYSGTTTIGQGSLYVGNTWSGTLGTGPVVNNGLLRFQRNMTVANSISGTGGVYHASSGTLILTGNNTYSGTTTIRSGTLQVGNGGTSGTLGTGVATGGDDEDNATLVFNRSDTVTIDKSLSGYIDLIQQGTGTLVYTGNNSCGGGTRVNSGSTLVLTGSNTYTGTTTIDAGGTLQIGSDNPNVLPNGTGKWNVTVNGVLDLNGYAPTINGLNGSGTVRSGVAGATTLTVGAGNRSGSFSGVIQDGAGTVALTKTGTATQTLTGTNTYSGTTTIGQGTLQVGSYTYTGTLGTAPVVNNATLRFSRYGETIVSNSISGTGAMYSSSSVLILTGANSYSGTTTISSGTLQVGNGGTSGTLGTGAVTGGNDEDYVTLAFNRSDTVTLDNAISGYVTLDQRGTGTLIYIGNNSSGGGTRISGGTLQIGDGGTTGTLGASSAYVTSSGGGQLVINRSDTMTVANSISGAIDLVQQGTGVVALTGNNTYTGDTTINAGTLQVTGSVTRTSSVTNHGTLLVSGTGSIVRGGVSLSGTGGTPSGSETYLSWNGLSGDAGTTYTTEVSTDNGVTYTAVASVAADTSTFVATGLQRNTAYRTRIVATSASGAKEIYETGSITTLDQPDESAWYRVDSITSDEDGSVLSPSVLGFTQDDSWTYAGSPMGAVLQQVQGLVTDGSIPTIDANGEVKVWHVVDKDGSVIISDFYTFAYPSGGYSEVIRYITPYTVGLPPMDLGGGGPPPCTNPCNCGSAGGGGAGGGGGGGGGCGGPGRSGASRIAMNAINSTAGASMCNLGGQSGLTYSSRELTFDSGYGPGWSDVDELAAMVVAENVMAVRLGAEQALWFDVQLDGSFAARYGSQDTLVHDATNHLFVLTRDDGTRYEFYDGEQTDHPAGSLHRTVASSGATIEVSGWTETGENGRVAEVLYKTATDGPAYQKRVFTYVTTDDGIQHIQTLTLLEYDDATSAWVNVRQITYGYYADGDAYGLPGDLKTILTQQWDAVAADWTGTDTNYFRYYTDADSAHEVKRVLTQNAYAAFVAAYGDPADPTNPNAGDTQTDPLADYTCFYYEYDADHRVSKQVLFGKSDETSFTNTRSSNLRDYNNWDRKSVETQADGTTTTTYTNYIGQMLLSDVCDASGNHTLNYYRYDDGGRLVLSADPSAFVEQSGQYYDESLPDLVGFASGNSPYLSDTDGLFEETVYYTSGAVGQVYQEAVAQGETSARLAVGTTGGPELLASYQYTAQTVDDQTIYVVAASTTYPDGDPAHGVTITYAYTWYADTFQVQQQTATLPAIATDQNGSGLSTSTRQWYDAEGNLTWTMDELGRVSYYQYDAITGELARSIDDIDAATASSLSLTPPAGWTLPAANGASQTSDYQYDAFGRIVEVLGPEHTVDLGGTATAVRTATWTFYNDATHETRYASGYVVVTSGATTIVGPVSITRTDPDGRVTDRIQADYTGTLEDLATATIAQTAYASWTTYQYVKTQLVSTRVYHDIPASGAGTSGTNYGQTSYGYEDYGTGAMGRQNKTVAADGTIARVVLDARGNVLQTWTGTDDTGATDADPTGAQTPGNNMVLAASYTYDASGNLLESRTYFDTGASDYYATVYQYDWRNRLTDVLTAADTVTHYEYDNLGRTVWNKTYASDDFVLAAGELRAQTETLRDDLGRIYESRTYEVDPTDGTVDDYLPSTTWYDARGYVVKTATANGLFRKYEYDDLSRPVASYTSYDVDEAATDYAAAISIDGDTVIEQNAWWYDAAGNAVASATYERLPDDTTTTGELTAANSYATASVAWYDGLGRLVAMADYGREDVASGLPHYFFDGTSGAVLDADTNGIPDIAETVAPQPYTAANPSSLAGIDFQLQRFEYNAAGRAYRTIDNLGRIDETQFDDAGRTVRTIENYDNGTVEETDTEADITVDYEYDAAGRLVTMIAYNAKGDDSDPGNENVEAQATKYLYESAINASWQTAAVYPDTTDVLTQDAVTKVWTITTDNGDHVSTAYDRTGRTASTTDQRGVVHTYSFDAAGRLAADTVTDLGTTGLVDDAVLRVGTTYDDMGRVRSVTNYSDTAGTTAVNEVRYEYDGWGNLYREYQEHDGTVDANTLFVQYDYDDGATGGVAQYVRLAEVTYPNGREVQYGYGTAGAIDDIMSRLATIGDGTNTHASYKYLGAERIVAEDYEDIAVRLDYTADNFAALDRFGRVIDQVWTDYGSDPDVVLDRYTYTYDRAGNRTGKANALNTALSETYDYNDLDELISTIRNDGFDQSWDLDALGNWSEFDDDGTAQTRDTNAANEITSTTGIATPSYDRAGNMTTIPSPTDADPSHTLAGKYDAWNRLVEVSDGGVLVAKFAYDGTGRRILKMFDSQSPGAPDGLDTYEHIFLSDQQVIETRQGTGTTPAEAETLQPKYQNVWSPRYVDSLILRDEYSSGILQPVARLYYLADANYNVTALVDSGGEASERYAYSAYGEATIYTTDWSATRTTSLVNNTTLYTGRELDLATNLYYYRARYYSADLGTFVSGDPIAADRNLYRYVHNRPTSLLDPFGLYKIEWKGDWPADLKRKIVDSLLRVSTRCDDMIKDIDKELASLSPCMRKHVNGELQKLRKVFQDVKSGISSWNEDLDIYHYDFGGNSNAEAKADDPPFLDPWIAFNDGIKSSWQSLSNEDLDILFFHELSHLYGTEDDDSYGDLMNAHTIDTLMLPGQTVSGNVMYKAMKRRAAKACKCPPPSAPPGLQSPGFPDPFGFPWIF